jgi:UDP-4-amino-4,6-dideoxy-N-acetyl-beta-L-altrosamine transaminase
MIPYGRQHVTQADIDAVESVLRSDYLTQGPVVPRFEAAVAKYAGAAHALAVNSATSALHLACLAVGVGPGDVVWTSPVSFVASANCALYCGATVDFVDIDAESFNMSVAALAEKLEAAARTGTLPKAVIPVHLCGRSCDMAGIRGLADRYGFRIIEDASHAIGGRFRGEPVGNCRYSDITVFSFHPVKIITTAEGGMLTTNDDVIAERVALLRSHGISRDRSTWTRPDEGDWYYEQVALGFNYRMTELQAALGLSQLERIDDYVGRRHAIADRYSTILADLPIELPASSPESFSALHLYVVRVDPARRAGVFKSLRQDGIGVNVHYIPIPMQPWYEALGFDAAAWPAAMQYYRRAISLPMFPTLEPAAQDQVASALRRALA